MNKLYVMKCVQREVVTEGHVPASFLKLWRMVLNPSATRSNLAYDKKHMEPQNGAF